MKPDLRPAESRTGMRGFEYNLTGLIIATFVTFTVWVSQMNANRTALAPYFVITAGVVFFIWWGFGKACDYLGNARAFGFTLGILGAWQAISAFQQTLGGIPSVGEFWFGVILIGLGCFFGSINVARGR